jgi:glucoamylase
LSDPNVRDAPGGPGIPPRWTSSAKSGIGTALNLHSRVWFTLSHGILNEIYYPRVDQACTRDQGFLVTDGKGFFSEEKRNCKFENRPYEHGVPVYELTNTCMQGRYRIEKEIFTDPYRNVVIQRVRFVPLLGTLADYRLYAILAPHLGNCGFGNNGWVGDYKGFPMLYAQRDGIALAFSCSTPWKKMSAGFVGVSDGWQDISTHFEMQWQYMQAEKGNIALTGEVDLEACGGEFVMVIGFGGIWSSAGQEARSTLLANYGLLRDQYVRHWRHWHGELHRLDDPPRERDLFRTSMAVMRSHESKDFLGGIIASLSIPWGFNKGDEDLGGYHLIWPRDLVETAGGMLAGGAAGDAVRVLHYLQVTQEEDGHWAQNLWLDGRPYWNGVQMDETALPILLLDMIRRDSPGVLGELSSWWPTVRKAAGFIVRNGPVTQQDRWEEDGGYSPFTLAIEIAGLLAAADIADLVNQKEIALYLRETADTWNENIERWIYATNTDLARQTGVEGYYVRISPPDGDGAASPIEGFVPIKNRPPDQSRARATQIISPDALALVRFGLRAPDDPRIVNTVTAIDAILQTQLPQGPGWYRYNLDGYGEHDDGSPFDGTGVGRAWPLLTGERAHYELAAGRTSVAVTLLGAMEKSTEGGRLIPEQVWDRDDIPQLELWRGKPTGSACPLVWAHAEYVKLRRSLKDGAVFDQPPQTVQRYQVEKVKAKYFPWRFNNKPRSMPQGKLLRIVVTAPARVHWSFDGWTTAKDSTALNTNLGVYAVDLPTGDLASGRQIIFTFFWPQADRWEGRDFTVVIE